jgi:hypothetical protein
MTDKSTKALPATTATTPDATPDAPDTFDTLDPFAALDTFEALHAMEVLDPATGLPRSRVSSLPPLRPELHAESRPELHAEPGPELHAEPRPELRAEPRPELHAASRPELDLDLGLELGLELSAELGLESGPELSADARILRAQGTNAPDPRSERTSGTSTTTPPSRPSRPRVDRPSPAAVREVVLSPAMHSRNVRPRVSARGTRHDAVTPGEQIRTMIFAPEATCAAWIEGELSRAPISILIQVGRRVRTVVSALVRDPPPRPHVLIVDFDAVSPGELLELHSIRHEGWTGRLIALGTVPPDLRASLEVDQVIAAPLVRDSLLDCVAGTGHATATVPIPAHMLAELAPNARSRE